MKDVLRSRALMNVLASFVLGVVITMLAPPAGYALASGATVALIFIYRNIKRAKTSKKSIGVDRETT